MPTSPEPDLARTSAHARFLAWADRLARQRPDVPYMAPFMAFLLLLTLNDVFPYPLRPLAIALRGIIPAYLFWVFRRHYPPLGRPHWIIAIVAGVLVALGWVYGQHFFNTIHVGDRSLGGRLFLFPGQPHPHDPRLGPDWQTAASISALSWWSQASLRILVASLTVPIVEEIFWRAFLLRVFVADWTRVRLELRRRRIREAFAALFNWDRFYELPLGKFTGFGLIGTSLLSIFQHPDNWAVSILCWLVYNGLMYWKKSILLMMLTHGITNLVLYSWVVWGGLTSANPDWYWLFW